MIPLSFMDKIIVGDYVKTKTKKGRVYMIDSLGQIIFQTHNGMKPTTHLALRHQVTKITKQEFQDWAINKGHTSIVHL